MNKSNNSFKDITYSQKRICVMPCNSLLGSSLVDCLRNDDEKENAHIISGVMDPNEDCQQPPHGLSVLVCDHNKENLLVLFADCDIVILELLKVDFGLLEFLLWKLEEGAIESNTQILVVSSPLLWSENASSAGLHLANKHSVSPRNENQPTLSEHDTFQGLIFGEADFARRKCLPCFELLRLWENRFLELEARLPHVKSVVLVPGIVYGRGEDDLYPLLQDLLSPGDIVKVYGKGTNFLPLCHVSDLVACIKVGG